jgi:DNA-binding NtrC family response regulator
MRDKTRRTRLLLVDDEEDFLRSSAQALGRRGLEVQTARDGATALEMIAGGEFDVVVLDLKMPGLDGEAVFDRIRASRPSLPVIMLTGHGSIPHAFQTSKKGISDYVAKPCDIDDLASRIEAAVDRAARAAAAAGGDAGGTAPSEQVRVLLVDDEAAFLSSMKKVLERRDMEIALARSGAEALERMRESPADVAVVDVKMPGMDGLELLRRMKADFEDVKVILRSGHPTAKDALEGVKLGASEYLPKPPDVDALAAEIRHLSRQRREDAEARRKRLVEEILRRYPD